MTMTSSFFLTMLTPPRRLIGFQRNLVKVTPMTQAPCGVLCLGSGVCLGSLGSKTLSVSKK